MSDSRSVPEKLYASMEKGINAFEEVVGLFADNAVYIEPFTGQPAEHTGRKAIEAFFDDGLKKNPPELSIEIERIDIDGETVTTNWVCKSPAIPAPVRGTDKFTIRDGRILRMETTLDAPPDTEARESATKE